MFKVKLSILFCAFLLTLFLGAFPVTPAYAEETTDNTDPFARFGNFTEGSDWVIDHRVWSDMLYTTVVVVGRSSRTMASTKNTAATGTNIKRGSRSPARFESNRVLFHLLKKEHVDLVVKYRKELEILPNVYPLANFDKNEQLAYWLNLHNAVLFEHLVKRYPISKLKKLRYGGKGKPSLWDEKLVTVEGVPLSLNDIQNNILIRHWNSPMVLYGLYHGAIGGPSLPDTAFTGVNVNRLLRSTAREFINSNRGFRFWDSEARVSLLYEWGKAAFPDWEDDVARHLREFARGAHLDNLDKSERFTAKFYDWYIADTKGGTLSAGPIISTAANLLTAGTGGTGQGIRGGASQALSDYMRSGLIVPGGYDANTAKLLREMARKYENPPLREGIVTSIECGTGPCPRDGPDDAPEPEDEVSDPEGDIKD